MSEQLLQATHGTLENPLRIGEMEIPCYVLEDGRRVVVQSAVIKSLGMAPGGSVTEAKNRKFAEFLADVGLDGGNTQVGRLARFIASESIRPYISAELLARIINPIQFKTPSGNAISYGYEATILADICESVLKARQDKRLNRQQYGIAEACEMLVRGWARVGIIALVDEATGYQEYRAKQALEEILQRFVSAELAKWAKTFEDGFYQELFRLRNITYNQVSTKRPQYIGKITNDIIYQRLAPDVLEALKRVTPRDENGRLKHKLHQHLTVDYGIQKLREHLASVTALMKASPNWTVFYRLLERSLPRLDRPHPHQLSLLDDESDY
jgi:hypothetical protein